MKAAQLLVLAGALAGGMLVGCQDDNNGSKHQEVQEKTVTDPNGNVVSHTEQKSDDTSNHTNNVNP